MNLVPRGAPAGQVPTLTHQEEETRQEDNMVQFIDRTGTLTTQGENGDLSIDLAMSLYRDMVLARRLDTEALALQRQGELGLWLMSLGQEAAQVGSIRALAAQDHVFPSYREHAAALCRGISPSQLLSQWRGVAHSGWDPDAHRFHVYTLVLGAQTLHATGYAIGAKLEGTDEVVLAYFGDGATSQGDVNEALNWAATMSLPVLFFCQNNGWAISTPTSSQSRAPLYQRASGFGMESCQVDGNDVLAVFDVTKRAVERIRAGGGPAFIEAITYRMAGHSTSDDPSRYRNDAEQTEWAARDPLARMSRYLSDNGVDASFFDAVEAESDELAAHVRKGCLEMPDPEPLSIFEHVYAEEHPLLVEEREQFAAYLDTFDESETESDQATAGSTR